MSGKRPRGAELRIASGDTIFSTLNDACRNWLLTWLDACTQSCMFITITDTIGEEGSTSASNYIPLRRMNAGRGFVPHEE